MHKLAIYACFTESNTVTASRRTHYRHSGPEGMFSALSRGARGRGLTPRRPQHPTDRAPLAFCGSHPGPLHYKRGATESGRPSEAIEGASPPSPAPPTVRATILPFRPPGPLPQHTPVGRRTAIKVRPATPHPPSPPPPPLTHYTQAHTAKTGRHPGGRIIVTPVLRVSSQPSPGAEKKGGVREKAGGGPLLVSPPVFRPRWIGHPLRPFRRVTAQL